MKRKKYLGLFIIILIVLIFVGLFLNIFYIKLVNINGKIFMAELALTSQKQTKGLSQRKNLCNHCAMLFKFNQSKKWPFWMKGMQFNLDIVWVSDGRIIYMVKNISYKSKEIITPPIKADQVLEINAGLSSRFNFKPGDKVRIY